MVVLRFLQQPQPALPLEALQDLQAAVHGAVVGGDHLIHSLIEVKAQHALKDVRLITAQQGQHQGHGFLRVAVLRLAVLRVAVSTRSGRLLLRP